MHLKEQQEDLPMSIFSLYGNIDLVVNDNCAGFCCDELGQVATTNHVHAYMTSLACVHEK